MTEPTDTGAQTARMICGPDAQAAVSLFRINERGHGFKEPSLGALHAELVAQTQAVCNGDLRGSEARLIAQALVLDSLFHFLLRRGLQHADGHFGGCEPILRLAMRAQAQSRVTLESLAQIKNPPLAYVGQANIGQAVQVNNGVPVPRHAQGAPEGRR